MGQINISFAKDITSEIQDFRDSIPTEFKTRVIEGSKEDFAETISIYVPVGATGDLATHHVVVDTGEYSYFFDNEMMYYPFVILGTKPHSIDPIPPTQALAFVASDGTFVVTKHVDHPGTAPYDYMEMAFDPGMASVDSRLEDMAGWMEDTW